ncbi:MAG: outer membrane beta-barrel protein [Kiritimatiellae bacterium]|nr:outer membrane beta-barrel protein [Kiritimatiellia bacterium]
MKTSKLIVLSAIAAASAAQADIMDRPKGYTIGERMTLYPYVGFNYTYDSNIDSSKHSKSGSQWVVSPTVDLTYLDENWSVTGRAYYQYHAYNKYSSQLNTSSYGENISAKWANSSASEKGWSLIVSEDYRQISQDDDMTSSGGRGIGRDRQEFTANGAIERRLNAYMRLAAMGNYYLLDYDNNNDKYAPLYGWKRTVAGGEIGFAPSPWTELILHANYQWYRQDNDYDRINGGNDRGVASESKGYSFLAGIGTRATERIDYRLLGGWTRFEYGNGTKDANGFTYQASAKWKVSDTLSFMALGSSYYQPSETQYASAIKVYTGSVGVGKSFIQGKVSGTFDLSYRKESHECSTGAAGDYDTDIWTTRLGLSYCLNRFVSLFGSIEYQTSESSGGNVSGHYYDYDRFRGTVGFRLTY